MHAHMEDQKKSNSSKLSSQLHEHHRILSNKLSVPSTVNTF